MKLSYVCGAAALILLFGCTGNVDGSLGDSRSDLGYKGGPTPPTDAGVPTPDDASPGLDAGVPPDCENLDGGRADAARPTDAGTGGRDGGTGRDGDCETDGGTGSDGGDDDDGGDQSDAGVPGADDAGIDPDAAPEPVDAGTNGGDW